jgi:arginine transport system substrate-binding protein
MKLYKYVIVIVFLIFAITGYFVFKKSNSKVDTSTFTVGTAAGYAPWVSINEKGEYEGYDIDVIKAIAKQMNKKLILKDLGSMSSLFMALEQNKIDAIIWGMSITQDRLDKMIMIRYQGDTTKSFPLLFWKKIPEEITSINDMKGKKICVEPASSQDTVLSKYPFINKIQTEKVDDALLNIQYDKADAAFVEPAIAKKFKNKYPQIQIIDVLLAPEDQEYGFGICIKKENVDLSDQVKQAIDILLQENIIQEYESKWKIS